MKISLVMLYTLATTPAFADDLDEVSAGQPLPIETIEPAVPEVTPDPTQVPTQDPWDAASGDFTATKLPVLFPSHGPAYTHAISVQLATLDGSGMAVQFERVSKRRPKTSVALAIGGRSAAHGEYASQTAGFGVEVKRWLRRPLPMTGWYVGARTDVARTTTHDVMEDREIGKMTTWTTGVSVGYRWVLFHKVELTPSLGAAMVVEGGAMSPTTARGAGTLGLTAGYTW